MNLIYIFDNFTFNNNTFIINTIKRWFCYELNNIFNSNNDDIENKITIMKTGPTVQICTISIEKKNLIKVLSLIDGLIYKRYIEYPKSNLKDIFEYLQKNNNPDNKVVIFSSINSLGFNLKNSELIDSITSQLTYVTTIYNIGKYSCIQDIIKNVKEIYVDYRINKIEKIINKEHNIFTFKNFDLNLLKPIELIIQKKDILSENDFISKYLNIMYNLELYVLSIEKIDDDVFSNIKSIMRFNIWNYLKNVKIANIISCFKNSIQKILDRKYNKCPINVPIDTIPTEHTETNLKYIMEFYQQIYPKIINYYLDLNLKNFNIPSFYLTTEPDFKKILNYKKLLKDSISDDSVDFLTSNLTISDWIDEYNELNPFGFLIKFTLSKFAYKGLIDENSTLVKWYPNLVVSSVSNNCVSLNDYYQLVLSGLDDINENGFEDGEEYKIVSQKESLKLNDFTIIDKVHGDSNILLPIYINKNHWNLTKLFWTYHMSLIFNTFEYNYNKKMDNIYYLVMLKNFNMLNDPSKYNNNLIRVFIYYLRTCIELMLENKYINSVQNEVVRLHNQLTVGIKSNLITNNLSNENLRINSINFMIRIIQWIVSSNSSLDKLKKYLFDYRNIVIKDYIEDKYKLDYWDNLKLKKPEDQEKELNILKYECVQENKSMFELEIDLIGMCELVNSIYKIKGFNQFIKFIDKNNGCLPTNSDCLINCDIFKSIFNNLQNNKSFNIDNYVGQIDFTPYLS